MYLYCLGESARNTSGQFGDKQQTVAIWSQSAKRTLLIYCRDDSLPLLVWWKLRYSWEYCFWSKKLWKHPCLQIKVTKEVRNLRRGLCLRLHVIVYKNCSLLLKQVIKQWSVWVLSICLQFYSSHVQLSELFVICVALQHEAGVLQGILERSWFSCKDRRSFPFV